MKLRIFSVLLAALFLALASCGGSDGGGTDADAGNGSEKTPGGETAAEQSVDVHSVLAGLPDTDYGGYEFRILTTNRFNQTLEGRQAPEEEETGEPINDALHRRDRLVETKHGVHFKYTLGMESDEILAMARRAVRAGSDEFDMGMDMMMVFTRGLAQDGAAIDFNSMPNIDLSNDWWSKYAQRDLTIAGRFYFPTGDITARFAGSQYIMLFNRKLFLDYGYEYPYQMVLDGEWTIDVFSGMIRDKTRDMNGDGVIDKEDFFGAVFEPMVSFSLLHASGEGLTKIVDGNPVLNVGNERALQIMDAVAELLGREDVWLPRNWATYDEVPVFVEDRALFAAMTGTNLMMYREMESDFGIIPLPKWDKAQPEYYSFCQAWGSAAVVVPQTNPDIERTGTVIESLAAASRYLVTPAAYDVTLKTKYARDETSEKMLDIIVAGSRYDFMYIYNWGNMYSTYESTLRNGDSFVPRIEALEDRAQIQMEATIEAYESFD